MIAQKTVKNLPKSIAEKAKSLELAMIKEILHASHSSQTGMFDSHPSDGQRIKKAKDYAAEGVFHCPAPASVLFSNFGMTCESITDDFYRNEFGVTKQMIRKPRRGRR